MKGDDGPLFRPSEKLDFELELVCPSDSALMQHSLYQPVTCVSHIATTESVNLNSECNEQRLCSSTANVITDMWLAGVRAGEQHLDREPSEDAASFTPQLHFDTVSLHFNTVTVRWAQAAHHGASALVLPQMTHKQGPRT